MLAMEWPRWCDRVVLMWKVLCLVVPRIAGNIESWKMTSPIQRGAATKFVDFGGRHCMHSVIGKKQVG